MKQVMHYETINFTLLIRILTKSNWPVASEHH